MKVIFVLFTTLFCFACGHPTSDQVSQKVDAKPLEQTPTPTTYDFLDPSKSALPTPVPATLRRRKPEKAFCHDPKMIPVWNAIRRDAESRELLDDYSENPDCRDMFKVSRIDLNADGKPELVVRAQTVEFCGGVGNCRFWVFEKRSSGLRLLLVNTGYTDRTPVGGIIRRTRNRGYRDIELTSHFRAGNQFCPL